MPIAIDWHPDLPKVILYRFAEHWTWDEFHQAFGRSLELAAERPGERYDVIGDFSNAPMLPPGSGISHVYSAFRRTPANCGLTVVITTSRFIRAMVEVMYKVHPDTRLRFAIAPTAEDAWRLIAQQRAALTS